MIRVIYRWKVKEDDIANFQEVGFYPVTADIPKKRLNFSKGRCWSICLNVRFATVAAKQKRTFESGLFFTDPKPITAISSSMIGGANSRR